jgi:signal transduction histidine kinase
MSKSGQSSFRRILLSRILLLTIPVLLMGEYVTYKKARSSLLETARLNLTESAAKKAGVIESLIESLQSNLLTASQTVVLQSGSISELQTFIAEFKTRLPPEVKCLQLSDPETKKLISSTCGPHNLSSTSDKSWAKVTSQWILDKKNNIDVTHLFPKEQKENSELSQQMSLILNVPVYVKRGNINQLRYILTCQSNLPLQTKAQPMSLSGYTVIIDQNRDILAHPNADRIGRNISQEEDSKRLENLVKSALAGRQDFLHLFSFERNGVELLAGYTAIPSPISSEKDKKEKWVVVAITRIDYALNGLQEIQQVLVTLIIGLIVASTIAAVYIAGYLATPLEKLRDYALKAQSLEPNSKMPSDLKVYELNQLVEALNTMVKRLQARAKELEMAYQEAQVANRLKTEILRTVSHELRTPLNAIINSIELVKDELYDDEAEKHEFLQISADAALHLLNLINDILDIAVIESGKISILLETVDIREVLEEAVELEMFEIKEKGLDLIWQLSPQTLLVKTDKDKLKQVFINILSNAVKFTEKGNITISTLLEVNEDHALGAEVNQLTYSGYKSGQNKLDKFPSYYPTNQVVVKIKDTGIGINIKDIEKLFLPFVKVDGSNTCRYGGLGLGLAISQHYMELIGGTIEIDSDGLGKGTTLTISLPLAVNNVTNNGSFLAPSKTIYGENDDRVIVKTST